MLTTLGSAPTALGHRRIRPVFTARWITTRPPSKPKVRTSRWQPVSILDVGEIVPAPEATPDPLRTLRPPEWTTDALCAQLPVAESDPIFHGIEHREAPGRLIAAANTARAICSACWVSADCLTYALTNDERYGVWGGTSGRQREKLRQRMVAGATVGELVTECLPAADSPTPPITEAALDARLVESVPTTIDAGYDAHMLRVAGHPWRDVAEKIGAGSPEAAQRLVSAYLQKAAKNQSTAQMQEALQTQVDRYEAILKSWWAAATTGNDEKAALVVLRTMERLDRVLRLTEGDVVVTKETLVVSADPGEYVRQLQEVVAARTSGRS